VSAVVGAAVPAAVCRWGLCPCCPGVEGVSLGGKQSSLIPLTLSVSAAHAQAADGGPQLTQRERQPEHKRGHFQGEHLRLGLNRQNGVVNGLEEKQVTHTNTQQEQH